MASVVADASVVINLNATGYSMQILDALPNRFVVTEQVKLELDMGRRNNHGDADALSSLVSAGLVEIVSLGDMGERHFLNLVAGQAVQTLDDGEAATIAYGFEHGATVIIDDRKAIRICTSRHAGLELGCTVDLLRHSGIQSKISEQEVAEALFNALQVGKMRVPSQHYDWVLATLGRERAARCNSLPRSMRKDLAPTPKKNG